MIGNIWRSIVWRFQKIPSLETKSIQQSVINHINELLHLMGHNMKEYNFVFENLTPSTITKEAKMFTSKEI